MLKNRTKLVAMVIAAVMMGSIFAGCGSKPAASEASKPAAPASSQPAVSSQVAAPAKAIVCKIGTAVSETHPQYRALLAFEKALEKETNGEIDVQVFANSQLGNERDMIEGLQMGSLQMAKTSTAVLSSFVPAFMVFDLPYVFPSKESMFKVLDGEIGKEFMKKLESVGLHSICYFDAGARSYYTKKEIKSMADLKGVKIRVMESPLMIAAVNAMGGIATPLPASEVYSAIQQDVVGGAENSHAIVLSQKHYEVTKFFTLTQHFMTPDMINMSKKFYDSLSASQKAAVDKCAVLLRDEERKLWAEDEKKGLEDLKSKGMTINEIDKTPFIAAVKPIYAQFESKIGKETLDKVIAAAQAK